jgi:hypothetical protein
MSSLRISRVSTMAKKKPKRQWTWALRKPPPPPPVPDDLKAKVEAKANELIKDDLRPTYFRHTGKWWLLYSGLTLDECIETIRDHGIFHPA